MGESWLTASCQVGRGPVPDETGRGARAIWKPNPKNETRITKGIGLKEIGPQTGDPEKNIPKKDFQLRVIAFRIIIIPRPTPKPHAPAPVVCLALLQASSLHPAKMGEAAKEGGGI